MVRAVRRADLPSVGEIILESMVPVPAEGIGVKSLLAHVMGCHRRYVWEHRITTS